jgi:hypothetical protein
MMVRGEASHPAATAVMRAARRIRAGCGLFATALLLAPLGQAAAAGNAKPAPSATPHIIEFDHTKTGYELLGFHKQVACEECHVKGVFRGTPRDCVTCHSVGSRFVTATTMSPQHFPVGSKACGDCHVTSDWLSVNVRHDSAMAGKCNTCHDGIHASGKSANHFSTQNASCDYCHTTFAWQKAYFDHSRLVSVAAGTGTFVDPITGIALTTGGQATPQCNSCHNGSQAQGPGANHIPIPAGTDCISCHGRPPTGPITLTNYSTAWVMTGVYVHANFAISNPASPSARCSYCHNNTFEVGKGGNHLPTSGECNVCHTATIVDLRNSGAGFVNAVMSHAGITAGCATCHDVGRSFQNIAAPTLVTRLSTPPAHVPTTLACETCHTASVPTPPIAGGFKITTMNHTGISGNCASCHLANTATGMTVQGNMVILAQQGLGAHIATSQVADKCEACHSPSGFTNFQGAVMTHQGISLTGGCAACHESTVSFAGMTDVNVGPGGPTKLVVRPGGQTASGFAHPATGDCSGCHNSFTSFTISISGTGMPTGHIPTTQTCSLCHAGGYGLGKTVMNHSGATSCGTCHGVSFTTTVNGAAGTPFTPVGTNTAGVTHIGVSGADCSVCHTAAAPTVTVTAAAPSYSAPGAFRLTSYPANVHAYVSTSTCATCHDASTSTTFTGMASKIPTIVASVGSIVVNPTTVAGCATGNGNAHGALGECSSCHSAASIAVPSTASTGFCAATQALPPGHFATSQPCSLCHSAGYALGKTVMNHTGIASCNSCHNGQTLTFGSTTVKPISTTSAGVSHMTLTSGDCVNCHTESIPSLTVSSSTPSYSVGGGFRVNSYVPTLHNYVSTASCATCHDSSAAALTGMSKIQTVAATVGSITTTPTVVAGCATGNGSAHGALGECSSCHLPSSIVVPGGPSTGFCAAQSTVPANHIPYTGTCATSCHAAGYGYGKTVMDHNQAAGACSTCHAQGAAHAYFNTTPAGSTADGSHIVVTSSDCSLCHAKPTATQVITSPTQYNNGFRVTLSNAFLSTVHTYVSSSCGNCHAATATATYGQVTMKLAPSNHIPNPGGTACTVCHVHAWPGPTVGGFMFTTAMQMVHTGILTGCSACHDPNSYYFGSLTIKLRPGATVTGSVCTPSNNGVAHPTSGDCSTCHSDTTIPSAGTLGFCKATSMPPNHIPIGSQACSLCHASGFGIGSGVMNHAGNTYPCTTCHGTTSPIAFYGVTPMYAAQPGPHIPLPGGSVGTWTTACNVCHVSAGLSGAGPVGGFTTGMASSATGLLHGHATVTPGQCNPCHRQTVVYAPTGSERVTTESSGHQGGASCDKSGCHSITAGFNNH